MKNNWTLYACTAFFGATLLLTSCGGDNREAPDSTSIETDDMNRDAPRDTTTGEMPSGGTGTDASGTTTTGTTSGSTTGGTTM